MDRTKRPCAVASCRNLTDNKYCDAHAARENPIRARRNPGWQKMYKNTRYLAARERFLITHPICNVDGCTLPATDLDHIVPHRGDWGKFLDPNNWQGLCHKHHSIKTSAEDGGFGNAKR